MDFQLSLPMAHRHIEYGYLPWLSNYYFSLCFEAYTFSFDFQVPSLELGDDFYQTEHEIFSEQSSQGALTVKLISYSFWGHDEKQDWPLMNVDFYLYGLT